VVKHSVEGVEDAILGEFWGRVPIDPSIRRWQVSSARDGEHIGDVVFFEIDRIVVDELFEADVGALLSV
jgi:hypothetical protein